MGRPVWLWLSPYIHQCRHITDEYMWHIFIGDVASPMNISGFGNHQVPSSIFRSRSPHFLSPPSLAHTPLSLPPCSLGRRRRLLARPATSLSTSRSVPPRSASGHCLLVGQSPAVRFDDRPVPPPPGAAASSASTDPGDRGRPPPRPWARLVWMLALN
jgi:hypothetical protein